MHEATKELIDDILAYPPKMERSEILSEIGYLQHRNPVAFRDIKRRTEKAYLYCKDNHKEAYAHFKLINHRCEALECIAH